MLPLLCAIPFGWVNSAIARCFCPLNTRTMSTSSDPTCSFGRESTTRYSCLLTNRPPRDNGLPFPDVHLRQPSTLNSLHQPSTVNTCNMDALLSIVTAGTRTALCGVFLGPPFPFCGSPLPSSTSRWIPVFQKLNLTFDICSRLPTLGGVSVFFDVLDYASLMRRSHSFFSTYTSLRSITLGCT